MIVTSDLLVSGKKHRVRKVIAQVAFIALALCLSSCTRMNVNVSNGLVLPSHTRLIIGPLANHTDTPLANRRVESMLVGYMQTKGFKNVTPYPRQPSCEKLLYCADESMPNSRLVAWARHHHVAFVLTGSVNEWRYKVGLDGEPVAGVSLALINVNTGKTVWTGVGGVIGGSRSGLDIVGQQLLVKLLNNLGADGK